MKRILIIIGICISTAIITLILIIRSIPTDETKVQEKVWNLLPEETKSILFDKMEDGKVEKVKIDEKYEQWYLDANKHFPYDKYKGKTLYLVIYDLGFDDKGNYSTPLLVYYDPFAKKIAAIKWGYWMID